jgi:hypothetical protein
MTTYRVGDVVAVEFAFSDMHAHKRRPGLVLMADEADVLLARLTTHPPRGAADVALQQWPAAALP